MIPDPVRVDAVAVKPVSGTVATVVPLQSIGLGANTPSQAQLSPTTIQVPLTATVPQAALAATGIGRIEIGTAFPQQTIGLRQHLRGRDGGHSPQFDGNEPAGARAVQPALWPAPASASRPASPIPSC